MPQVRPLAQHVDGGYHPWREKFYLESAKAAMAGKSDTAATKALQKENDRLKTLLAESTLAVDALKKTLEGRKR